MPTTRVFGILMLLLCVLLQGCGSSKSEAAETDIIAFDGEIRFDASESLFYIYDRVTDRAYTRVQGIVIVEALRVPGQKVFGELRVVEPEDVADGTPVIGLPAELLEITAKTVI